MCPAYDPFYLAVCEFCGQVIKPQALARHIQQRHGPSSNHSNTNSVDQYEDHSLPSNISNNNSNCIFNLNASNGDSQKPDFSAASSIQRIGDKSCFSSISLEPIPPGPGPGLVDGSYNPSIHSLTSHVGISPFSHSLPPSGSMSTSSSSSSAISSNSLPTTTTCTTSTTTTNNPLFNNIRNVQPIVSNNKVDSKRNSQTNSTQSKANNSVLKKSSIRGKLLPCKDREYDPDKHCGVKTGDMDKPCTRSLTCKTHSLTLRRSVVDRSKVFDELLAEHRASKEAALRAAGIEIKPTKQQLKAEAKRLLLLQQASQQQPQQQQQQKIDCKTQLPSSPFIPNSSSLNTIGLGNNNVKIKQEKCTSSIKASKQANHTPSSAGEREPNRTISSTSIIKPSLIDVDKSLYLPHHPKPIALCTFNARQISLSPINCDQGGSQNNLSSRLFNRQRDLTYSALSIFRDNARPGNRNLLSLLNLDNG